MDYFSARCSWKRYVYSISFHQTSKSSKIPPIQHENSLGITFQKKSNMFLKTMFPPPPESAATALKPDDSDTIAWNSITFEEVEQAIKSSSPRKALDQMAYLFSLYTTLFRLFQSYFMLYLQNYWIMASIQHAGVKQLVLY
jgi:hypothetical protein